MRRRRSGSQSRSRLISGYQYQTTLRLSKTGELGDPEQRLPLLCGEWEIARFPLPSAPAHLHLPREWDQWQKAFCIVAINLPNVCTTSSWPSPHLRHQQMAAPWDRHGLGKFYAILPEHRRPFLFINIVNIVPFTTPNSSIRVIKPQWAGCGDYCARVAPNSSACCIQL